MAAGTKLVSEPTPQCKTWLCIAAPPPLPPPTCRQPSPAVRILLPLPPSACNAAQGGDEALFARAFESFDMLSRCLDEQDAPAAAAAAPATAAPAATLAAPPGTAAPAPASRPPADEPPLISFD